MITHKNKTKNELNVTDTGEIELPARPPKRRNPKLLARKVMAQRTSEIPVPNELKLSQLISS